MADGSITAIVDVDDKKAQQELSRLKNKIKDLTAEVEYAKQQRLPFAEQAEEFARNLDIARQKLKEMESAAPGTYTDEQLSRQKLAVNTLENEWKKVADKVEIYDKKIQDANEKIDAAQYRAGVLEKELSGVGHKITSAIKDASSNVEKLNNRIMGLAKRVFVFTLLTKALRSLRSYLWENIKANDEAAAAVGNLKGALLTLAQPLLNVVIPAFTTLANILSTVIGYIASFIATLTGTTISATAEAAENLYDEQNALKGVGGAAKKTAKQLLAFDEIQKLTNEDTGGGGGGTATAITPLFDAIKSFEMPDWLKEFATSLKLSINDVLFDWENLTGEQIAEKAIAGLTALAGGVAGFAIGGIPGALIGTLTGLLVGLVIDSLIFNHDGMIGKEELLSLIIVGISGLIGGAFGIALTRSVKGAAIGFTVGAAVGAVISKLTFNGDEKISSVEITRLVRTALFAIAGGIIGGVIGGGPFGALIGMSIGVALSLLLNSLEIKHEKEIDAKAADTELGKLINASLEKSKAELEAAADLKVDIESITGEISPEKLADLEFAQKLIDEIFEIDAEDNKTAGQLAILNTKIAELNGLGLDGLQIAFDETTGHVTQTKDAMQGVIDKLLEQYKMEALHDAYVEQFKNQYEAERDVKRITEELETATGLLKTAQEEAETAQSNLSDAMDSFAHDETVWQVGSESSKTLAALGEALDVANENLDDAKENVATLKEALQQSLDNYSNAQKSVEDLQAAYENLVISIFESTDEAKKGGENIMEGTAEGINEGYKTAEKAIEDAHKALQDAANAIDGINSPSTVYAEHGKYMMEGLAQGITDNAYLAEDAIRAVCNSLITIAETGLNSIAEKFNAVTQRVNENTIGTGVTIPQIPRVSIPRLAAGAVIPPNREFLAVLGDQRSGNNIEAPEAALQAMANQAASANAAYLERIIALLQEGKVMMIGSETFARLVYNTNRSETARHGGTLVNVSGRL